MYLAIASSSYVAMQSNAVTVTSAEPEQIEEMHEPSSAFTMAEVDSWAEQIVNLYAQSLTEHGFWDDDSYAEVDSDLEEGEWYNTKNVDGQEQTTDVTKDGKEVVYYQQEYAGQKPKTERPSVIDKKDLGEELMNALVDTSMELQNVLSEVPYMREIIMSGQIAMLAFKIAKENAGVDVKNALLQAWNSTVGSLVDSWIKDVSMPFVVDEYLDYLSIVNPAIPLEAHFNIDLREYWDATRTHNDRGTFEDYQNIMMRQGHVANRKDYVSLRQKARGTALDAKLDATGNKMNTIMHACCTGIQKGKVSVEDIKSPFPVS